MAGLNKAMLIGNLGADPELKHTTDGQSVCELRVATNRTYTDRAGNRLEDSQWHRVVVWGKQGEHCAEYLRKGRQVYVEGRLQTRSWQDSNGGGKRWITEIVADNVQFLQGGRSAERSDHDEAKRNGYQGQGSDWGPGDDLEF